MKRLKDVKEAEPITDIDGNNYKTVQIGNQIWMAENLKVSCFRNGTHVIETGFQEAWDINGEESQHAWCYYNNNAKNGIKYGKLYNWYMITDTKKLAPNGWHIPSDKEWSQLIDYLGGEEIAGKFIKLTSVFNGLLGGLREYYGFSAIGINGEWWSSTKESSANAWTRGIASEYNDVLRRSVSKSAGFSVRCIKD